MTANDEQRKHERVSFFLVPADREVLPVWVFKPQGEAHGHAGLILNMSEGGLQVLTQADVELAQERWTLRLLLDEDDAVVRFTGHARRVWQRPLGKLGHLSGFEFEDAASTASQFLGEYAPSLSARRWVRCLLLPA